MFGDASQWYLIADANGLRSDADLRVGATLTIPNQIANVHNSASTFKPYDPGELLGDTSPTLPTPNPPPAKKHGHKCGALATVIVIAVAAVVAFYTQDYVNTLSWANGAIAAAAGAAAGSATSQVVAMKLGVQDGFSWKAVATAAVTGGLTKGVNANFTFGNDIVNAMANGAANNVIGQGVALFTRQQTAFSWSSVAVAAISGPINQSLVGDAQTANEFNFGNFASNFGRQLIATSINTAVSIAVYDKGQFNFANVAADAFGNALGNSIVGQMKYGEVGDADYPAKVYEQRQQALWDHYGNMGLPNLEDPRVQKLMEEIDNRKAYRAWLGDYDRNTLPEAFGGPAETTGDDYESSIAGVPGGVTPEQARAAMPYALTSADSYSSQTPQGAEAWMLRLNLEAKGIHRLTDAQLNGANRDPEMERALRGLTIDPARLEQPDIGYGGAMYYDSDRGQVIVANRGTNFSSGVDWLNNGANALGFESAQFDHAVKIGREITKVLGDSVVFTGHSLGGSLATAQSLRTGAQAVTFNSEGVSAGTISRLGLNPDYAPRVTGYYIDGEVLSRVQDNPLLDVVAATYITPVKNVMATVGLVSDLWNGQPANFSSFGIAYVPEALGTRYPIPAVDLSGRPMSYFSALTSSVSLHGMEYVLQSLQSVYNPR